MEIKENQKRWMDLGFLLERESRWNLELSETRYQKKKNKKLMDLGFFYSSGFVKEKNYSQRVYVSQ